MAELIGSSGDNQMNALLSASYANQAENQAQQGVDDAADEALQRALLKKIQAKQAQMRQHVSAKETFSRDVDSRQRLEDARSGKFGHQQQLWGNSKDLQGKLSNALRDRFTSSFEQNPRSTDAAAGAINQTLGQSDVMLGPGVSRQTFNDVHASLMERPQGQANLDQALKSKIMQDPRGDRTTKQEFLRFAMRPQTSGVQIKMGGDMLGTLSSRGTPGMGQQASMTMLKRDPDNASGLKALSELVETEDVMHMPQMARGYATQTLARANGATDVKDGFVTVARDPSFKKLGREQQARLFAVLGEGRPSELRALTDKTLRALQSSQFPTQDAQVSTFLTSLSKQIGRNNRTEAQSDVDTDAAIVEAKRNGTPTKPALASTQGLSEEDAKVVRGRNRALVMRYYSKLNEHFDNLEGVVKNAKYRQDVTLGVIVRQPEELDTEALNVRQEVKQSYQSQFESLKQQLDNRQLTRPDYLSEIKQLQSQAFGQKDLSTDELTMVQAMASHADAGVKYLDLAAKKNRKLREVGQNIKPPHAVKAQATAQRPQGRQARFVRAGGGVRALPRSSVRRAGGQDQFRNAQPKASRGAPQRSQDLGATMQARMRNVLTQVDPKLSGAAQKQQITELVAHELTNVIANMVQQMLAEGPQNFQQKSVAPRDGRRNDTNAQTNPARGQERAESRSSNKTVQGRTSAWGIPQTRERDLGAGHNVVAIKAPPSRGAQSDLSGASAAAAERKVTVVRSGTSIGEAEDIYDTPWTQMSVNEQNVMKNLGWNGQLWDARNSANASWPGVYTRPFAELRAHQKASVLALGLNEDDWNESAQRLAAHNQQEGEED